MIYDWCHSLGQTALGEEIQTDDKKPLNIRKHVWHQTQRMDAEGAG